MTELGALARRTTGAVARFAADARDLFFPPHCPGCGSLDIAGSHPLCPACRRNLPQPVPVQCPGCGAVGGRADGSFCTGCGGRFASDAVLFAAAYDGTARELVHRFKYRADFAAGGHLGQLLAERVVEAWSGGVDLVVPVPLHRRRLWDRGFNQAALLARDVARRLDVPVEVAALSRPRRTRRLAGLDPEERFRELGGAFRVRRPGRIAGARVLLVDDVLTTGATAEGCCRALRAAGARWTGVAVAARVLRPLCRPPRMFDSEPQKLVN